LAAYNAGSVLLLGSGGQIGVELHLLLAGKATIVAPRSSQLDLMDELALRQAIRAAQPRWILNAAAYTAVDRAETEPDLAFGINADAVRILGEEAVNCGATVVHFSTDYVFDGEGSAPRQEDEPTSPISVYGQSKLAGEQALTATGAAHFTFRTSWVYSTHGKNFMLTILDLARKRPELKIVADQVGAPTSAHDLAQLTLHTMLKSEQIAGSHNLSLSEAARQIGGVYHACNQGFTNWFEFAQSFIAMARSAEPDQPWARLTPIGTADYPTAARRPINSRLDCSRLWHRVGYKLPPWEQSLKRTIDQVYQGREQFQP
jgi:dTDP-4-dehydrorhamnose reductase